MFYLLLRLLPKWKQHVYEINNAFINDKKYSYQILLEVILLTKRFTRLSYLELLFHGKKM